jgi:hypothetical protein
MNRVQKSSNSECYKPLSELFRFDFPLVSNEVRPLLSEASCLRLLPEHLPQLLQHALLYGQQCGYCTMRPGASAFRRPVRMTTNRMKLPSAVASSITRLHSCRLVLVGVIWRACFMSNDMTRQTSCRIMDDIKECPTSFSGSIRIRYTSTKIVHRFSIYKPLVTGQIPLRS